MIIIEHGTFTPLIFTSTGGMGKECLQYHSRLAQLISIKKGEDYAKTISWIRARTSFALLRSALICLRGSRAKRKAFCDFKNVDIDIEIQEGAIKWFLRTLNCCFMPSFYLLNGAACLDSKISSRINSFLHWLLFYLYVLLLLWVLWL